MTPLTQANSPESGSGGGENLVLHVGSLTGSGVIGHTAVDGKTPGESEAFGDDDTGFGEDTHGEDHRLLSSQRDKGAQLGFARGASRIRVAPGSFRGHVEGLRGSREVEGFDMEGKGAEGGWLARKRRRGTSAFWKECLVPVKLLQDKRTRAIVFVYSIFSVRCGDVPCLRQRTSPLYVPRFR